MAKITIYVGDDLKGRMDQQPAKNWSGVAQEAFELELRTTAKENMEMDDVIERLRASKTKKEQTEKPAWIKKGREWAMRVPDADELERLGELDYSDAESWEDILRLMVSTYQDDDTNWDEMSDFSEVNFTGDILHKRKPSKNHMLWWLDGVQEVWEEVKHEI